MKGRGAILSLAFVLTLMTALPVTAAAQSTGPVSRTVPGSIDRVWAVAESVLKSLEWEIDESDRAVGWMLTKSRGVDFKEYGVYGQGTRHRLRVTLKKDGETRTAVAVERELYTEERILWMTSRKPVPAADQGVENAVLDAIQRSL